jgi:hypothetical protein
LDAIAELFVARNRYFGYPVHDRAPEKTVGLDHLGPSTDLPKFVAPQRFFPALLVQGRERKLPPGIHAEKPESSSELGVPNCLFKRYIE